MRDRTDLSSLSEVEQREGEERRVRDRTEKYVNHQKKEGGREPNNQEKVTLHKNPNSLSLII